MGKTLRKKNNPRKKTKTKKNKGYVVDLSKSTLYGSGIFDAVTSAFADESKIDKSLFEKEDTVMKVIHENFEKFVGDSVKFLKIDKDTFFKIEYYSETYDMTNQKKGIYNYHLIPSGTSYSETKKRLKGLINFENGIVNGEVFKSRLKKLLNYNLGKLEDLKKEKYNENKLLKGELTIVENKLSTLLNAKLEDESEKDLLVKEKENKNKLILSNKSISLKYQKIIDLIKKGVSKKNGFLISYRDTTFNELKSYYEGIYSDYKEKRQNIWS